MAAGVLLVTHDGFGAAALASAERVHGSLPLAVHAFDLPLGGDLAAVLPMASGALRRIDRGEGVLILVDRAGGPASRLAAGLAQLGTPVRRVSGLSLPMLLRVLNYAEQSLDELALTAAAGARNGVVLDDA